MKIFIFLAAFLAHQPYTECFYLADIVKVTDVVVVDLLNTWELLAPKSMEQDIPLYPFRMKEKRLMVRMMEISREVKRVDRKVKQATKMIFSAISDIVASMNLDMKINSVLRDVTIIEETYSKFLNYIGNGFDNGTDGNVKIERYTLEDFAKSIVSHNHYSVSSKMDSIHFLITRKMHSSHLLNRVGVFQELKNLTEAKSNLCNIQQSPQQFLYNVYTILQLTQLKAYTMIQFSWMLLKLYDKGNFTYESEMLTTTYKERLLHQADEIKKAMSGTTNEMWRCDPKKHVLNETYTELTKLLQGFIVNEIDLNDQETCKEDCGYYQMTKQNGCFKDNYCSRQPKCAGTVVGCKFVDSDMWICQAPSSSRRRYDWIEYENGRLLGQKKSCSRAITKVDSWWRWLFWHCSYCFCLCDDPYNSSSDRYFNLRAINSDLQNNKVITGLRFVKINRVVHLQIQEGEMLPKGSINETSVAWKPVETYDVKDSKIKEGIDYHQMSWFQRAIDLDDLKLPINHVLTGVRFRTVGKHLNFEIQGSQYNYTNGKLIQSGERSQWLSNDNTDGSPTKPRKRILLDSPDVPTASRLMSVPDSESDSYMEFTASDLDMDASQSTVPFIDIQPVAPQPPVPLAGAGIFHKGQPWFGGFIAPKVFTLDFTHHIQVEFPELNEAQPSVIKPD